MINCFTQLDFSVLYWIQHTFRCAVFAAGVSVLLVAMVLFTHLRTLFGLVVLPVKLYLLGTGLILVPFAVMEISKALRRCIKRK